MPIPTDHLFADHLFILSHAGETRSFQSVIEQFESRGRDYRILTMATATDIVRKEFPDALKAKSIEIESLGIATTADTLPEADVKRIVTILKAKHVCSGVALEVLCQIGKAYKKEGATFTVYWDNWNASTTGSYFEAARKVEAVATRVIFPSTYTAKQFPHRNEQNSFIGGKPSLEKTLAACRAESKDLKNRKVLTWIGGYGPRYAAAFALFLEILANQKMPLTVILRPHPNATDLLEQKAIETHKDWIYSDPKGSESTNQVLAISDIVCTYESTVGFDALAAKKQVIYVIPEGDPFTNIELDLGIAAKVSDLQQWDAALDKEQADAPDLLQTLGIPMDSATRIADYLSN